MFLVLTVFSSSIFYRDSNPVTEGLGCCLTPKSTCRSKASALIIPLQHKCRPAREGPATVFALYLTQGGGEENTGCTLLRIPWLTSDLNRTPIKLLDRDREHLTPGKTKKAKSYLLGGHCFRWISPLGSTLKNRE